MASAMFRAAGLLVVALGVGVGRAAVLFQPLFHRFLHRFHLEVEEDDER